MYFLNCPALSSAQQGKFQKLSRNHKSLEIKFREWIQKQAESRGLGHSSYFRISMFKKASVSKKCT